MNGLSSSLEMAPPAGFFKSYTFEELEREYGQRIAGPKKGKKHPRSGVARENVEAKRHRANVDVTEDLGSKIAMEEPDVDLKHVATPEDFEKWAHFCRTVWREIREDNLERKKNDQKRKEGSVFERYYSAFNVYAKNKQDLDTKSSQEPVRKTTKRKDEVKPSPVDLLKKESESFEQSILKSRVYSYDRLGDLSSLSLFRSEPEIVSPELHSFEGEFFDSCSPKLLDALIFQWDVLVSYENVFQRSSLIKKISFEEYVYCLVNAKGDKAARFVFCEILSGITYFCVVSGPRRAGLNVLDTPRDALNPPITHITWPNYLRFWLLELHASKLKNRNTEDDDDDDDDESLDEEEQVLSLFYDRISNGSFGLEEILDLSSEEKITMVSMIVDELLATPLFRKLLDQNSESIELEKMETVQKKAELEKISRLQFEIEQTCTGLAAGTLNSMIFQLADDEVYLDPSFDKLAQIRLRKKRIELEAEMSKEESSLVDISLSTPARAIFLGTDRFKRTFWIFGCECKRVFVRLSESNESCSSEMTSSHQWGYYTVTEMQQLMGMFSRLHPDESDLFLQWLRIKDRFTEFSPVSRINLFSKFSDEDIMKTVIDESERPLQARKTRLDFFNRCRRCKECSLLVPSDREYCWGCRFSGRSQNDSFDAQISIDFLICRILIADMEIGIVEDAYDRRKIPSQEDLHEFYRQLVCAKELDDLLECITSLAVRLDRNYWAKDFRLSSWKNVIQHCNDTSTLVKLIYELDQGIRHEKRRKALVINDNNSESSSSEDSQMLDVLQESTTRSGRKLIKLSEIDNREPIVEQEGDEENSSGCAVCKEDSDPDQILLCDGCNSEYHTFCLDPPLSEIPEGDWFCLTCITPISPKGSSRARKQSAKDKSMRSSTRRK